MDGEGRIVPAEAAGAFGMVELRHLVGHLGFVQECLEAVGEAFGDVELDASDAGCGSTGCAAQLYPAGTTFYLYTPQLDHLSNDQENFGGLMTEVHICNSVSGGNTYGNTCN